MYDENVKYIVVIGNAFDGLIPVGPFDSVEAATNYAENESDQWSVVPLGDPTA